jgi:hypothetical protein
MHLRCVIEINPKSADAHRHLAVARGLQGNSKMPFGTTGSACVCSRTRRRLEHFNALLKAAGK